MLASEAAFADWMMSNVTSGVYPHAKAHVQVIAPLIVMDKIRSKHIGREVTSMGVTYFIMVGPSILAR